MAEHDDKEISELYSQLLQYSVQVDNLSKHATTVTGGLLAVAFGIGKPQGAIIAILPLFVLIPLHILVINRKINMIRIATYIRKFSNWQYEKRLYLFRNIKSKKKSFENQWGSYEFGVNGMFLIYCIVSVVCSFLIALNESTCLLIFPILGGIFLGVYTYLNWNEMQSSGMGGELEKKYFDIWSEIAENDSQNHEEGSKRG